MKKAEKPASSQQSKPAPAKSLSLEQLATALIKEKDKQSLTATKIANLEAQIIAVTEQPVSTGTVTTDLKKRQIKTVYANSYAFDKGTSIRELGALLKNEGLNPKDFIKVSYTPIIEGINNLKEANPKLYKTVSQYLTSKPKKTTVKVIDKKEKS